MAKKQRVEDDFTAQADEYVYQLVRKVTSERLTQEDVIEFIYMFSDFAKTLGQEQGHRDATIDSLLLGKQRR